MPVVSRGGAGRSWPAVELGVDDRGKPGHGHGGFDSVRGEVCGSPLRSRKPARCSAAPRPSARRATGSAAPPPHAVQLPAAEPGQRRGVLTLGNKHRHPWPAGKITASPGHAAGVAT